MLITSLKNAGAVLFVFVALMFLVWTLMVSVKANNDRVDECTAKGGVIVHGGKCVKEVK